MRARSGYAVGDARREAILGVALEEFAEDGYRGASLARIAKRAELSQAGLLHHFPSKDRLLTAVLDRRDERDAARYTGPSGVPPKGAAALYALADLVAHNARIPDVVRLFVVITGEAVAPEHPAHEWAQRRYRWVRRVVGDGLRAGAVSGELRAGLDAESHADRIIAMMDGLQIQWLLDPERVDMAGVFRDFVEDLLRALRA